MFACTDSLVLRAFRESDTEPLLALLNDRRVQATMAPGYLVPRGPSALAEIRAAADSALLYAVLEVKPDAAAGKGADAAARWAGFCMLSKGGAIAKNRDAGMAIALHPRWWGRGFGTEAVRWLRDYAFEQLGIHRLALAVVENNDRALAIYKKLGFVDEGRKRKANFRDGAWHDVIFFAMVEDEKSHEAQQDDLHEFSSALMKESEWIVVG